jgi:hypothetical protein
MGVNLVTRVRNFHIGTETFTSSSHDVQDGCVTPGSHGVLRFDFLSHNVGNADMVIGSPAARPDLFVWSVGHGHYHMKDFNQFLLFTPAGSLAVTGYKQAFCAIDIERISSTASPSGRFHDCNADQGISAGWADVYSAGLACQFIVLDALPDGDYTLQSTTNTQHKAAETASATTRSGRGCESSETPSKRLRRPSSLRTASRSTVPTLRRYRSVAGGRSPKAAIG